MATWEDTVELRLRIKDPLGAIAIASVADESDRTSLDAPARQTAYKQLDTGEYWTYDADVAAWEPVDLLISDSRIGALIDLYGIASAAPRVVKDIMAELGRRLFVTRTQDGAGSTDYQNLSSMKEFYKDLAASMEETAAVEAGVSTGRYLRMHRPCIAGGMLE